VALGTKTRQTPLRNKIVTVGNLTLELWSMTLGVYATGGVPILPSDVNLRVLEGILPVCADSGITVGWDIALQKIKAFQTGGGAGLHAEVGNATDLSAVTVHLLVIGIR
jgi:hypothetical protein